MKVKKITWRWLFNSFGVIVLIILAVEIIFAVGISQYYYNSVSQTLSSRAEFISAVLTQFSSESEGDEAAFQSAVRDYVSAFSAREQMELMTIDGQGRISLTSSGFLPDETGVMPDYQAAVLSETGVGQYMGEMGREQVMAVSYLVPLEDTSLTAVRLVVSLTRINGQIAFWIVCMAALGILVLLMVLFSSSYFISSIVNPVGEVGDTARKIAQGDFGARLKKRNDDEIGELCDTINYMAEKLGEAEQIKNDFISSVSHELRTPLTAIQGWGETVLDDGGENKEMLRRGMNIIISETGRLSQMVEELLDFSRIQSGRFQLDLDRVDALAELSDVVLMYTDKIARDNLTLHYDDSDLIVPIHGDKNKLRQVFVNILDNAVKYSDPGGAITVETGLDGDNLIIAVQDTGIGIAPENLPQVKKKFFKVSTTRRSSGIGLAVADEIVSRHNGTLELESELGKGTKVTITLPVMKQDAV